MAERHDGMVDVELDDEPDPLARPATEPHGASGLHPVHGAPPTPAGRRRRQAQQLRAAAAVIALGALVIAALAQRDASAARADDDLVAAVADTPGLVASLRTPLRELWRGPGSTVVVGDLALRAEESQGKVRTVARDATTGASRWVMPRSLTPGNLSPVCRSLGGAREDLACEVPGRPGIQAANTDQALGSTPGFLVVLDGTTGTTSEVTVLQVGTVGWAVIDGDLVTGRLVDGSLEIERLDPVTRAVRWYGTVALPSEVLARQLSLRVADGFVLVDGAAAAVLDATAGSLLGVFSAAPGGAVRLSSGRLGFTVWEGTTGTWHDPEGRAGALLSGEPLELAVDDGSAGALALVRSGPSLVGIDVVDIGLAWNRGPVDRVLLRLGGVLLLDEGGLLRGVDAATGANRWSVTATLGSAESVVVSDGLRVLAVVPGVGAAPARMTAIDLADGRVAWSVPMPAGTTALSTEDGTVVAIGEDAVVVLG